mgnify:CR=1 FL=1
MGSTRVAVTQTTIHIYSMFNGVLQLSFSLSWNASEQLVVNVGIGMFQEGGNHAMQQYRAILIDILVIVGHAQDMRDLPRIIL